MNELLVTDKLKPFWGRVLVIESQVDQEQRASGIVIPVELGDGVRRGIVTGTDEHWPSNAPNYVTGDIIPPGTVLYFKAGWKIGDTYVLDCDDILAYEEAS